MKIYLYKNLKLYDIALYSFLILSFFNILFYLYIYRFYFTSRYNHALTSFKYDNSQYVKGPLAKLSIGDDGLYALAGYYYFIQKGDVSNVNFENPPLGKYLTGLSILVFGNERVISVIYGFLLLFVTYKLANKLFSNSKIALLSVLLMSLSPLFIDQLTSSLIDLPTTLFFITGIYFFIIALKNFKFFYLSALFLALSFASKFFPFLPVILLVLGAYILFIDKKLLKHYILSLFIIPVLYLVVHASYFINNHSLLDFIKYQYWIIRWRSGNPFVVGNILRTLFLGKYQSWWDKSIFLPYDNWTVFSPLIPVMAFVSPMFFKLKNKQFILLIWIMTFIYFLYVFIATTGVEKYLLLVYPLYCILAAYTAYSLFSIIIRNGRFRLTSN